MLDVSDYILSYDNVRSTCGLSEDELPDDTIKLSLYSSELELGLDSLSPSDEALLPVKKAFLELDPDADAEAYNLIHLFSVYAVSLAVCVSLSMRAPKTLSDSKVTIGRFSPENTWRDVIKALEKKLADFRDRIDDLGSSSTTSTLTVMQVVKPAVDPVTGV